MTAPRRLPLFLAALLAAAFFNAPYLRAEPTPDPQKTIDAARAAMAPWLKLVDAGKYGECWDAASPLFQKNVTKAQWEKTMTQVAGQLGPLTGRKYLSAQVVAEAPMPDGSTVTGEFVIVIHLTTFKTVGKTNEIVTFMKTKTGDWKAAGYFVTPAQ